jgi:hypothetical protein
MPLLLTGAAGQFPRIEHLWADQGLHRRGQELD